MPQPVDFQTEIGRTVAAERIQQVVDRGALAAQQRLAQELEEDQFRQENTIHESPETQNEEIDEELKRRNPYAGRRRKRGSKDNPDEQNQSRPHIDGEGERLDVRV